MRAALFLLLLTLAGCKAGYLYPVDAEAQDTGDTSTEDTGSGE